jgi:hypothetical protein
MTEEQWNVIMALSRLTAWLAKNHEYVVLRTGEDKDDYYNDIDTLDIAIDKENRK